ncbi:iron chelate uptake ABC transporter family permease subunit [Corynebacterium macginleyi]|uniref:Iron ABC transporter permease n=1 Tax=Corynebacterium macginleyi TaxID=38290 RepID=A0ABS1Y4E5_9CORY|nr:iron ABC transporter permease [Corynebacterium macginleyi]MBK4140824.1 iron chelate uptake ABC transporter family permease subunit [Corynebacterium macginleyi]MBK4145079.1 iron chelate uptake ABC transporter family permease subunit [Corynebacterium macginleyi]MBK4151438.1 iron chelate uptake ABC transporter family permease subunit [Corynebacterium macginleyi]MBK4153572.1 iron chelate uptake ABC transporter family permease subunit [Corynebacterium macginleyi]MBK4157878.1 iron chelate uptake 
MVSAEVAALTQQHKKLTWQRISIVAGLCLIAAVAFVVSNFVGAIDISPGEVIRGIMNPSSLDDQTHTVLWKLRLPMAVMALLIGVSLSLAGAEMQTILNNPLAEPFTLGISAAAAFGGASSIVLKWQLLTQPQFNLALVAWLSAAVATAIIVVAAIIRGAKAETMVLLGIGLVFFFQAMLALIQYQSSAEALQQIVFWSMGSLTRANWVANGVLAAVLLVALPILWALSWRLTALRLGDARAAAMGINTARLRVVVLIVVSLVAATTVAFAGIIGFIGLVGPHIARMLVGEDQRYFVPASMAAGAAVMCAAHAVSLMIKPGLSIPIGIVTSLLGVPFFIAIVMARRRALWT